MSVAYEKYLARMVEILKEIDAPYELNEDDSGYINAYVYEPILNDPRIRTEAPEAGEDPDLHFVVLLEKNKST